MKVKKLNVLSLFGGMECGRIALDELGFEYGNYYYSEIDKFASKQVELNFPDVIHLGNVEKWREWDIDWSSLDLVFGGSPCQGFSFAGKMLAFDDPRSKLFFTFLDIVNHVKSCNSNMKFMLENVNMKKDYLNEITRLMGVEPININSNLVSAQNRNRWYWTNISDNIVQPSDRGIYLKDILEDEVDEKYYLSEKRIATITRDGRKFKPTFVSINTSKAGACLAVYYKRGTSNEVVDVENGLRMYTTEEFNKLQTIPSWYKWDCSDTQKYKMLGNGWTVEVIKHIFSYL